MFPACRNNADRGVVVANFSEPTRCPSGGFGMAVAHGHDTRDSVWKTLGNGSRGVGAWTYRFFIGTELTAARIAAWTIGLIIALIAAALVWLYFLDWNTMRGPVGRWASMKLG